MARRIEETKLGPLVRRLCRFVLGSIAWASILGIAPNIAAAQTLATWLGGTGVWNDPTQWSSDPFYPTCCISSYINAAIDSGTVDLNTSVSLRNLTLAGGTIVRSSGTFSMTTGTSPTGAGGLFSWSGGTLTNVPMSIRGGMAIDGPVHLGGGSTLDLRTSGMATQQGGDLLFDPGGGTIQTHSGTSPGDPDSTYSLLDDSGMFSNGGTGTLINFGTFQKIGGTGVSVIDATLLRSDTVTVASGTLRFAGDVSYVYRANTLESNAVWNVLNGSTLEFSQANAAGGSVIATNKAKVLLSGASARIADGSGNDILNNHLTLNQGFLTIEDGAAFAAPAGFSNGGTLTIQNGSDFTAPTAFTNSRTIIIGADSTFSMSGSEDYVAGPLTQTTLTSDTSTIAVAPGHAVSTGGTFSGIGTVQGDLINTHLIKPGVPGQPGALAVSGDFTEGASATFSIELGGPTSPQMSVLGASVLDGVLDISFLDGFTPSLDDQFVILTSAEGLTGRFSSIVVNEFGFEFEALYEPTRVILETTAVPEPGTLLLLSLGLMSISAARRRVFQRHHATDLPLGAGAYPGRSA
jgi:hypothetical protein